MKREHHIITVATVTLAWLFLIATTVAGETPLGSHPTTHFADHALEQHVRSAIDRPTGPIPLAEVANITHLHATLSDIQSLDGIEQLTSLQTLNLASNQFISDVTPLASLINLTNLNLAGNNVDDIRPLATLTHLTNLDLSYNPISDFSALEGLPNLRVLDVSATAIDSLRSLSPSMTVTVLRATYSDVTDVSPLRTLTTLETLDLSGNRIEDVTPLVALQNLKHLILLDNVITDVAPLGKMVHLESLYIDDNTVENIEPLAQLSALKHLYATGNRITSIEPLAHMPNLQWADFSGNLIRSVGSWVEEETIPNLHVAANPLDVSQLSDHVAARIFGSLRETHRIGDYTVRFYENHDAWFDHMTVWLGDTYVYGHVGYMLQLPDDWNIDETIKSTWEDATDASPDPTVVAHTDTEDDGAISAPGYIPLDITGDGHGELVVIEYSGGAHCCFTTYIFQLHPEFQLVGTIESEHSGPLFGLADGNGPMTITVNDWTFAYWKAPFVSSPAPKVTLQFDGSRFRVATDHMRASAPSWLEMIRLANSVRTDESWDAFQADSGMRSNPPSELWRVMLDLIYTGHQDLAWQLLDDAWPDNVLGKYIFTDAFLRQLETSPYWPDILHDMYGGIANPG